jgi:hypothetical protein
MTLSPLSKAIDSHYAPQSSNLAQVDFPGYDLLYGLSHLSPLQMIGSPLHLAIEHSQSRRDQPPHDHVSATSPSLPMRDFLGLTSTPPARSHAPAELAACEHGRDAVDQLKATLSEVVRAVVICTTSLL